MVGKLIRLAGNFKYTSCKSDEFIKLILVLQESGTRVLFFTVEYVEALWQVTVVSSILTIGISNINKRLVDLINDIDGRFASSRKSTQQSLDNLQKLLE